MRRPLKIYWIAGTSAHEWAFYAPRILHERGHDVTVLCPEGSCASEEVRRLGLKVRTLKFPSKMTEIGSVLRAILQLRRIFVRDRPDVVHYYMIPISFWARTSSWLAGVPVRIYKPPSVWELDIELYRLVEQTTAWMDSAVVASSRALERFYAHSVLGGVRTILSYYGVPLERFDPQVQGGGIREEFGIGRNDSVVVMVAYLVPPIKRLNSRVGVKGHEVLIHAARLVLAHRRGVKFLIVGEEPREGEKGWYAAHLRDLVEGLGLAGHVIFVGHRTDVPEILAAADLAVVPSISENVGGAVEPLLMCKLVVGSRVGGLPDVVRNGETGFLVPPGDPYALARAILHALSLPADCRQRMACKGRAIVCDKFDRQKTVDDLEYLYYDILSHKGHR